MEARDNYYAAKEDFVERIKNPDKVEEVPSEPIGETEKTIRIDYDIPEKDRTPIGIIKVGDGQYLEGTPIEELPDATIMPYEPEIIGNGQHLEGVPIEELPDATILPYEPEIIGGNSGTNVSGNSDLISNDELMDILNITSDGVSFK